MEKRLLGLLFAAKAPFKTLKSRPLFSFREYHRLKSMSNFIIIWHYFNYFYSYITTLNTNNHAWPFKNSVCPALKALLFL